MEYIVRFKLGNLEAPITGAVFDNETAAIDYLELIENDVREIWIDEENDD